MMTKFTAFMFKNSNKFLKKLGANHLIYFSDTNIDHIVDNLYLGDFRAAEDLEVLKKYNITHIINCAAYIPECFSSDIKYLSLEMSDDKYQDLTECIKKAAFFIDDATLNGGNVFIHCQQGVSRSASILISYIITKKGLSYDKALELVNSKRKVVKPNKYFKKQLQDYEKGLKDIVDHNKKLSNSNITPYMQYQQ